MIISKNRIVSFLFQTESHEALAFTAGSLFVYSIFIFEGFYRELIFEGFDVYTLAA